MKTIFKTTVRKVKLAHSADLLLFGLYLRMGLSFLFPHSICYDFTYPIRNLYIMKE